ncbi:hypothetical protein [Rubritalea marina]|uniref:hypothetical protein n=1 Tax=Rubritalea marina TaxID=361055 RepID=UPI00036A66A8|nr:hypothetical protein [Rubritalea marina]
MSENSSIVCKPTTWVKLRGVLILVMFLVFAYLFYHDGTVGYREKNEHYVMHELFVGVAPKLVEEVEDEAAWKALVGSSTVPSGDEESIPLPEGFDRSQPWPESLSEAYQDLKNESNAGYDLWLEYSGERGWGADVMDHPEDTSSLKTQMGMAYGSATLALLVLVVFLRILSRRMEVTETAYIAPGGVEVPYASMRRIDTRKWDSKGLATIEYEIDGKSGRCKVDGMVYGQFKAEEGAPAEKLFQQILANFKGELISFVEDDEDEGDKEAPQSA